MHMAGNGWKWLEMAKNAFKCLEIPGWLEMAGNCLIYLKRDGNGWEWPEMAGKYLKCLEMDKITGNS